MVKIKKVDEPYQDNRSCNPHDSIQQCYKKDDTDRTQRDLPDAWHLLVRALRMAQKWLQTPFAVVVKTTRVCWRIVHYRRHSRVGID